MYHILKAVGKYSICIQFAFRKETALLHDARTFLEQNTDYFNYHLPIKEHSTVVNSEKFFLKIKNSCLLRNNRRFIHGHGEIV